VESRDLMTINGQKLPFGSGDTILEVARRHGIDIPTLCVLKGASPTGACRICLVEVEGSGNLVTSCTEPATAGMVVKTETPRVVQARRMNLELLLASGHHNCLEQDMDMHSWAGFQGKAVAVKGHEERCPAYGRCRLQDLAVQYQVRMDRFTPRETPYPLEDVNPFIIRDFSRCILCGRCVQACNEIQVNDAISFGYRGVASKIVARADRPLKDSDCVFCGECLQACPVGALAPKNGLSLRGYCEDVTMVRTTCPYCGVGCQLYLHVKDNRVVEVSGVEDGGPNFGSLCVKGRFGYDYIHDPQRLKIPLIRENGRFREASWDEALDLVSKRLLYIKGKWGPDSIGVLCSARITNEENYLAQKFTRAAIGTNNIDHCARL